MKIDLNMHLHAKSLTLMAQEGLDRIVACSTICNEYLYSNYEI